MDNYLRTISNKKYTMYTSWALEPLPVLYPSPCLVLRSPLPSFGGMVVAVAFKNEYPVNKKNVSITFEKVKQEDISRVLKKKNLTWDPRDVIRLLDLFCDVAAV